MIKADEYYINNLQELLTNGILDKNPRPKYKDGQPAYSRFITQVFEEYDISKGEFPITTLRNTAINVGINEILWIYQKQSNRLDVSHKLGINWWDKWDIGDGTIGQRYGATIKRYDLMNKLLDSLKNNPFSRRHIINMYQEKDLNETDGLEPCCYETIWSVRNFENDFYLDMTLIQRSSDYIISNYINKIQYVALMMMVCNHLGYKVGKFCHLVQNLHIYERHIDAAHEILGRTPLEKQPILSLNKKSYFYEYTVNDFSVTNIEGIQKIKSQLELAI